MNIDTFLAYHRLRQNPFTAEEARLDPVFSQMHDDAVASSTGDVGSDQRLQSLPQHPDFSKIVGRIDQPSTAVVFGEKGSGKTAIRLEMERLATELKRVGTKKVFTVPYDDLNPVLDLLMQHRGLDAEGVLDRIRLEDHQDAILAAATTKLVDAVLEGRDDAPLPEPRKRVSRHLSKEARRDLATLALLYDQPISGAPTERFHRLRRRLRLTGGVPLPAVLATAVLLTLLAAVGLLGARAVPEDQALWWTVGGVASAIGAIALWIWWFALKLRHWKLARQIAQQMPAVSRSRGELQQLLGDVSPRVLEGQPLPRGQIRDGDDSAGDARYRLTRKLLDVLAAFGYEGVMVLVDRIDEPSIVSGDADRMRRLVWPMFDNKFLKQDRVGLKLLLPLELSYLVQKESSDFYQVARLDKQALIERLEWTGSTLYDLCSTRLNAVHDPAMPAPTSRTTEPATVTDASAPTAQGVTANDSSAGDGRLVLTDLFEPDVNREMLIDALDQMRQPRDAFKFMYQVLQEHCTLVPEEAASFHIARLTLETVRKNQSQRVNELYRGLGPA